MTQLTLRAAETVLSSCMHASEPVACPATTGLRVGLGGGVMGKVLDPTHQNLHYNCCWDCWICRFPPIAVAPALPAIPESCTPTDTSAGTPRSSSYHDMPAAAASSGYELRATAAVVPRGTSSTVTSGLPYSAGTVRGGEVVVIRRCDLALSLAPAAAHVHRQTAEQQAGQAVGKHFGSSCALVGAWFSSDAVALVGSRTL